MRPFRQLSRLLRKAASGVLASSRGSTYRRVRLASALAAALLDGLSEQPADGQAPSVPLTGAPFEDRQIACQHTASKCSRSRREHRERLRDDVTDEIVSGRIRDLDFDEISGVGRAVVDIDDAVDLGREAFVPAFQQQRSFLRWPLDKDLQH